MTELLLVAIGFGALGSSLGFFLGRWYLRWRFKRAWMAESRRPGDHWEKIADKGIEGFHPKAGVQDKIYPALEKVDQAGRVKRMPRVRVRSLALRKRRRRAEKKRKQK